MSSTFPDTQTTCAAAVCRDNTATSAATCDGKGACSPGMHTDCGGAGCNGAVCAHANEVDMAGPPVPGADMAGGFNAPGCGCELGARRHGDTRATLALVLLAAALLLRRRRR